MARAGRQKALRSLENPLRKPRPLPQEQCESVEQVFTAD